MGTPKNGARIIGRITWVRSLLLTLKAPNKVNTGQYVEGRGPAMPVSFAQPVVIVTHQGIALGAWEYVWQSVLYNSMGKDVFSAFEEVILEKKAQNISESYSQKSP